MTSGSPASLNTGLLVFADSEEFATFVYICAKHFSADIIWEE